MSNEERGARDGVERRARGSGRIEVRAGEGEGEELRQIVGYAAVFNDPAEIYGFREQIAPGAFAAAIGRDDVRALIDHVPHLILARSTAGTLRMREDERGLAVEIDPGDTSYARDLIQAMDRGDVSQMSFAFRVVKQQWDESGDMPLRTIQEVELRDVSVVTYPAYENTEAALRSLKAHREATGAPGGGLILPARRLRMKHALRMREIAGA